MCNYSDNAFFMFMFGSYNGLFDVPAGNDKIKTGLSLRVTTCDTSD